ncbi:MAG: hypothetical protein ACOVO2_11685 [Emticicia sp.]|uniref:hypothetical protein n=1 Tax=Emticicia sp. TaxID=1930953 RepID=UPI003BA56748
MKKIIFAIALLSGIYGESYCQTTSHDVSIVIPAVTMIRISPTTGNTKTLTYSAPTTAGDPITGAVATGADLYLQYSSIMGSAVTDRKIYVTAATSSTLVNGLNVKVAAATPSSGTGVVGTTTGAQVVLAPNQTLASGTTVKVLDGITSCYTGTGATDGSLLTYTSDVLPATLSSAQYGALRAGTYTLTVTYTLADN